MSQPGAQRNCYDPRRRPAHRPSRAGGAPATNTKTDTTPEEP